MAEGGPRLQARARSRVTKPAGQMLRSTMSGCGIWTQLRRQRQDTEWIFTGLGPGGRGVTGHLAAVSLLMAQAITQLLIRHVTWVLFETLGEAGEGKEGFEGLRSGPGPEDFPTGPRTLGSSVDAQERSQGGRSSSLSSQSGPPPGSGPWLCPWSPLQGSRSVPMAQDCCFLLWKETFACNPELPPGRRGLGVSCSAPSPSPTPYHPNLCLGPKTLRALLL